MKSPPCHSRLHCATAALSPLRVGVLGCSDIARRKFIPALLGSSAATLAAVSSRTSAKAATFVPDGRCEILDHEGLLASPGIDLVYLSLPNHLHEEWTIRALQAGKHVICEKPLGLSPDSVDRMMAAAEASGCLLYENLMYLHHPQHARIREMVASGIIGRIRMLRTVFTFPRPKAGDFRLDPLRGGGALHDLSRYPLGTALYHLEGVPEQFRGHALMADGLNLAVHGTAITPREEVFSYAMAFGQQYDSTYEISGETGRIILERAFTTPADHTPRIRVITGTDEREVTIPPCDHFRLMIDDVSGLISGRGDFNRFHQRSRLLARMAREMEEGCHG